MVVFVWMCGQCGWLNLLDFMLVDQLLNQCVLVIDECCRVWQLGNELFYIWMYEVWYVFGVGQDFVWGVFEVGVIVVQVVCIVMKCSDYVGIGVDMVCF